MTETPKPTAVVQRILSATPDDVFNEWLDPDALQEWMCPRPAVAVRIELEPVVGGLRDSFGTWVDETYGVKQAQEWLGPSDPATTLQHYVRLTTAARAKAVAGLDEVTRAALEAAQAQRIEDEAVSPTNVVELASRRR